MLTGAQGQAGHGAVPGGKDAPGSQTGRNYALKVLSNGRDIGKLHVYVKTPTFKCGQLI